MQEQESLNNLRNEILEVWDKIPSEQQEIILNFDFFNNHFKKSGVDVNGKNILQEIILHT